MNNDEAKFILRGYRPSGADASHPDFHEALEQARKDPALHAWFEREQAFDAEVAKRLRDLAPPSDLRASILAGARAPKARRFPTLPIYFGIAAAIAVLLSLYSVQRNHTSAFPMETLAAFAADDVLHGSHGGKGALTSWVETQMSTPTVRVAAGLPADFEHLKKDGCRTLSFNGKDALEVCFERNGEEYHLYVCRLDSGSAVGPRLTEKGSLAVATWSDAHLAYALVSRSQSALTRVL